jgi:Ca-activated chloride channel family protein
MNNGSGAIVQSRQRKARGNNNNPGKVRPARQTSYNVRMIDFARPLYLLLFLLLPALVWLRLRARRSSVPHPDLSLFASPKPQSFLSKHAVLLFQILSLFLLILALARPRTPDLQTRLDTDGIALMMVVDCSGSMSEVDFSAGNDFITRLAAVKRVFRQFIEGSPHGSAASFEGRPTDLIGLVCFATRPEVICPLTLEHNTLLRLLEAQEPRGLPGESETNISDALAMGLARLRVAGPRRKVLILLTDGEHNQSQTRSTWTPRQAAHVAAGLGISIYTIDAGAEVDSASVPDDATKADALKARENAVATMEELAKITQGRAFAARNITALAAACREIDRLEREVISSYQYRRYHEAWPWLALGSFIVFLLALVCEHTLRPMYP